MGKSEEYELDNLLHDVRENGFAVLRLIKLYRLLGKGNRAAGTWRVLEDSWNEIYPDHDLFIEEMPHEMIILTTKPTVNISSWSGS